jgi:anthranilate synthase
MCRERFVTKGGITVHRTEECIAAPTAMDSVIDALDARRGALVGSSYEYPGRYTRWDIGFVDPPVAVSASGREVRVTALNERGEVLLPAIHRVLELLPAAASIALEPGDLRVVVRGVESLFSEEERSRQPSVFSVLRALVDLFFHVGDPNLGLFGAFGYDLAFQFEPIRIKLARPSNQRDLVLYLPDEIVVADHRRGHAARVRYEFEVDGRSTLGLQRTGQRRPFTSVARASQARDHEPSEFAATVGLAREAFMRGDLFEVVASQTFFEPCVVPPSELFRRLRERNPSPYGFLMNLGEDEYLVGASPEMYVRVEGDRVETCPVSGTIARGGDSMADATQIEKLLNSRKDESELTMCTDVDRNDKSRICLPGSVRVLGRRQIEMYSRLIHTVDHVEGRLRPGFDALDAFLAHTWAVTTTGAPKTRAIQFLEDHERSPRAWYGAAVGVIGFNGNLNTGITLRTVRVVDGTAEVRAGATLLYESDPEEEERETQIKASALLDALRRPRATADGAAAVGRPGEGKKILLLDHQDSFVHTLSNYFRQTGAEVVTRRAGVPHTELDRMRPDLVVLSPGPGAPRDFDVSGTLAALRARSIPAFGVCLGLQGMVEHFGGELAILDVPMHGKPSLIQVRGGWLFEGLPSEFVAGRYHSLYAREDRLPAVLRITAKSDDGVIMAIEHRSLPYAAVQFHPESILSLQDEVGIRLIRNVVAKLAVWAGNIEGCAGGGEDLAPVTRDEDRVLELRGQRAVGGYDGPAVVECLYVRGPQVDHRLDGEDHPRAKSEP